MVNNFADFAAQVKGVFKSMSVGKLITLAILMISTVAGIIALVSWSSRPDYMPLYTQLNAEDASAVVARLREQKITYKLSADGSTIQIPRNLIYEKRLEFASEGLPRGSGIGFEVFDNTKLGQTEFVQNINYQRALQGELSRTIDGLAEVESSRVHIVITPRSLFLEEEEPATASVILKLRPGRWLSNDQIEGIVHLVSSSVPRLSPQNVTIVDHSGNLMAGAKDQPSASKISSDQLEFQHRKEKMLENRVLSMLEKVVGKDKAIVRVACELNFVQQEKTEEMFFPENQVVRSEQLLNETSSQGETLPQGVPGLASNITRDNSASVATAPKMAFQKEDATRNYEIGKMTSHQVMPVGKVQRISVAVVVDGTYEKVSVGKRDQQKEELKYVPRSAEEMSLLENIVKRAVNYDQSRGDQLEVANIAFSPDDFVKQADAQGSGNWLKTIMAYSTFFKYLAAGLFLLFTFLFVIKPLIRWLTDTPWEDVDLLEQLPRSLAEIESQYAQKEQTNYVNQAAQIISVNQEDTTRIMKQWLKET